MKKYAIVLLFTFLIRQLNAQVELTVEILGLKNDEGKVLIELLDANEKRVEGSSAFIKNKKAQISFDNLKTGKYAVRCFHDENNNDELDTNMLGIPKERYGISNEPYGMFGPKDFKKWLFTVDKNTVIKIKTK